MYKYGGFIGNTIQWTARINYAGRSIENATYKDTIGPNQTLLVDNDHPVKIYSATADHKTGEITPDSINLMDGKSITTTDSGFTVDLGNITHTVMIVYYTSITNADNLSNSYGNTGDLYSNKTVLQNVPVNISTNKLGSDAGSNSEITSIIGHKIWNVPAGTTIPNQVTIHLWANNKPTNYSQTISKDNDWLYEFNNLPKSNDQGQIVYTVTEDPVNGFTSTLTGDHDITNTLTPGNPVTNLTVKKDWEDNDNENKTRPDSITVQLYANDKAYGDPATLTGKNWIYNFSNLPKFDDNGNQITYTTKETNVPEGYSSATKTNSNDPTNEVITNTYKPATTTRSFTVKKVWAGSTNHPDSVKVYLTKDGVKVDSATLNSGNGWSKTWKDLAIKNGDQTIEYSAIEDPVPDGFVANVDKTNDGVQITNTAKPTTDAKTNLTVTKTWNDKDNQDKLRPDEVKIQLLADGKEFGIPVTLNNDNNWSYAWDNLDKNTKYSVKESPVTGYTTEIKQVDDNNISITNTHTPVNPGEPGKPTTPTNPTEPTVPSNPGKPTTPTNPTEPTVPSNPDKPTTPTNPTEPTVPSNPDTSTDNNLIPSETDNNESSSNDTTPLLPDNPLTPAKASDPNISNNDSTKGLLPQTGNQTTWILSLFGLIVLVALGIYKLLKRIV